MRTVIAAQVLLLAGCAALGLESRPRPLAGPPPENMPPPPNQMASMQAPRGGAVAFQSR